MDYQGRIIRPPSEADSILLQVTVGCSHNKCTFCGAYKDKRFSFKPLDTVASDIAFAARHCQNQRRVFLCDGDALIMPQERLRRLLASIREHLPWVTRVATYAGAKSLKRKSRTELEELRSLGLSLVYMGLESGDQATLERVCKGSTVRDMIEQGCRARQAGLKLNVTVLLGLAGKERSQEHALATGCPGRQLSPPRYAGDAGRAADPASPHRPVPGSFPLQPCLQPPAPQGPVAPGQGARPEPDRQGQTRTRPTDARRQAQIVTLSRQVLWAMHP
ncbi:MAG: radical SAM protein [Desulfovibrionales bacterium]